MRDEFSARFTRNYFDNNCFIKLTAYLSNFTSLFNSMKCLFYQKYVNHKTLNHSPKLSFTNIQDLCSNSSGCESFLESDPPDNLTLRDTDLKNSIDPSNSSVMN